MLEDEGGEGEQVVGGFAGLGQVAVGRADEIGDLLDVGPLDPLGHFLRKLTSSRFLASFVQNHPETALRRVEKTLRNLLRGPVLEGLKRIFSMAFEPVEVFLDSRFGKGEGWFSDDDDAMLHGLRECRRISLFPRVSLGR